MECLLGQVLQVVLAILTRVRPKDLGGQAADSVVGVRALDDHFAGTPRRVPRPRLPQPATRRRSTAADRRHRRRPRAGVAGGATLGASLIAAKRVTGRVVVYGTAGGETPVTNWEPVYRHQIHVIGLNIGVLIQAAPQIFGEVMGELFALVAAGVLTPGQPTAYELADGPKALAELETRATVGKLALQP